MSDAGPAVSPRVVEGALLWTPRADFANNSNVARHLQWLKQHRGQSFDDYHALWRWSVRSPEAFWAAQWDYFDVQSDTPYRQVLDSHAMPGARLSLIHI